MNKLHPDYVWCPQYCFCTYEGGMVDLALCRTRKKAREILHEEKVKNFYFEDKVHHRWEVYRVVKRYII